MTRTKLFTLATVLVLTPTLFAWKSAPRAATLLPASRLWVSGTSTVRSFECKATQVGAAIQTEGADVSKEVLGGQKAVQTVVVRVPANKLDCSNSTMNEHMQKAIKSDKNALIEFRMSSYDIKRATGAMNGKLNGTLSLGGVKKDITFDAVATDGLNGALHVIGSYQLQMTDFGLKPPALMMGTMKVGNKVTVKFDLLVK
jgi:polyisoprenoid-binding protein YceI